MSNPTKFKGLNPSGEFEPLPRPATSSQFFDVRLMRSYGPYHPNVVLNTIPDDTAHDYGHALYKDGYKMIRAVRTQYDQGTRTVIQVAVADMDGTTPDIVGDLLKGAKLGPAVVPRREDERRILVRGSLALWYSPELLERKELTDKVNIPQKLEKEEPK